jgi:hypothetical protein
MTKVPFAITAVLGLPLFIGALILGPAAFDLLFHRRPPERFLIPAGFNGWARIEYRQKGAPPLPSEDGRLLLQLDAHGTLKTSSDPLSGHGRDDFYYYPLNQTLNQTPDRATSQRTPLSNVGVCKGGMIWQVETMVDEPTSTPFTRFYVGTEAQYRHEVDPNGKDSAACE